MTLAIFACLHDAYTAPVPSADCLDGAESDQQQDEKNGMEDVQAATAAAAAHEAAQAGAVVAFGAKEAKTWHLATEICSNGDVVGACQRGHPKLKLEHILFLQLECIYIYI